MYRDILGNIVTSTDPKRLVWYGTECAYWTDNWEKLKVNKESVTCPICSGIGEILEARRWYERLGELVDQDFANWWIANKEICFHVYGNIRVAYKVRRKNMIKIKVGPNGKLPTKGSNGAAGYDLYCATDVHIQSGGREQIPLDIYSEFDKGIVASIRDRSGIAKDGLFIAAGTIDSDYRGPWSVIMWNFSDEDVAFRKGDRVAQVLFLRLDESELIQTNELNMTERGSSGFGSTGK